jgi:hypothetical protein
MTPDTNSASVLDRDVRVGHDAEPPGVLRHRERGRRHDQLVEQPGVLGLRACLSAIGTSAEVSWPATMRTFST